MSDERPQETIDQATDQAEQKFDNCWVDCEREIIKVERGGIVFRMRSITIGEEQRIADELNMRWRFKRTGPNPQDVAVDVGDVMEVVVSDEKSKQILTVCAALGAWKKHGSEGWSDPRELTQENVEALKGDVLELLFSEYARIFRTF